MTTTYAAQYVEKMLTELERREQLFNEALDMGRWEIDEFALLVSDSDQLATLDALLCRDLGWEKFNVAHDNVVTAPIRSAYSVEYHFFRHKDVPWRLEVMRLSSGVSPLHTALRRPTIHEVCLPVHASFKAEDEADYAYARVYIANRLGYAEAQRCDSTYGRFSYWTNVSWNAPYLPYLKPRVNLRDEL